MARLTGPRATDWRSPLRWAAGNVNRAGGVDGRPLKLVWFDLGEVDLEDAVRTVVADESIAGVVGPETSADSFAAVDALTGAGKLVISPSATSGELYRAFSGRKLFWRTVESDVGQVRALLTLAKEGGASSVSLLTSDDLYGETFFDWFTFTATELGLSSVATVRQPAEAPDCRPSVDAALAPTPDVLVAVSTVPAVAVCIATAWRAHGAPGRLLFADGAETPTLIEGTGAASEGLEGTGVGATAGSGFDARYRAKFGEDAPAYAASGYDAVTLMAYALERSNGSTGPALARALKAVVDGRGVRTSWNRAGIAAALRAIRSGRHPNVTGTTGPLRFDRASHTDLESSTYRHWRVENGAFTLVDRIASTDRERPPGATGAPRGNRVTKGLADGGGPEHTRALLVAASSGWENYRHQADVLALYRQLRANGVRDEDIVLVIADDLAAAPENADPGTVRSRLRGPDLRAGAQVDYDPRDLTADGLASIVAGQVTATTPAVLASQPDDNVFVFIAGHGSAAGVQVNLNRAVPRPEDTFTTLSPEMLSGALDRRAADHGYRNVLVAIEACEGGVMTRGVSAPRAMVMASSAPGEDSLSTNYRGADQTWLADQFADQLARTASRAPGLALDAVYRRLYFSVAGSHVTATRTDGSVGRVNLASFLGG